jgi:serine/threonine-protein kinase
MSEVYEAVHDDLKKRVALKVLSPELGQSSEARARFAAEAVNAARVWHTHVVDVTDYGTAHGLPYLVMNLLVGTDLASLFARRRRLPIPELIDLMLPVACAVAAGHAQGIVHRDLKPENIYLHREGPRVIPKLLDFGVSRLLSARRITVNANVFGTPHYMAPEQARGELSTDPRADQYAMGVILYEGLTGQLPRDSGDPHALLYAVAYGSFLPPSAHVALPHGLERVILRAMAHDPNQRFASMDDLARALVPFASAATRTYWQAVLEASQPSRAAGRAAGGAAKRGRNPNAQVTRLLTPERSAPRSASSTLSNADVLDVAGLFALLRKKPSLMAGALTGLMLLLAASVWSLEQSGALTLSGLPGLSEFVVSPD